MVFLFCFALPSLLCSFCCYALVVIVGFGRFFRGFGVSFVIFTSHALPFI